MSAEQARRAARIALGGAEQRKQQMREARGVSWIGDIGRDVQYGVRTMLRRPTFTMAALLILALGIGANTAIFSADHAVLFRRLPYRRARTGWWRYCREYGTNDGVNRMQVAPGELLRLAGGDAAVSGLRRMAHQQPESERRGSSGAGAVGAGLGESVRCAGRGADAGPRSFRSGEDAPGAGNGGDPELRRFGSGDSRGDPEVVGKTMHANDQVYTVAGVMPAGISVPDRLDRNRCGDVDAAGADAMRRRRAARTSCSRCWRGCGPG